jgi:hypothetical protein
MQTAPFHAAEPLFNCRRQSLPPSLHLSECRRWRNASLSPRQLHHAKIEARTAALYTAAPSPITCSANRMFKGQGLDIAASEPALARIFQQTTDDPLACLLERAGGSVKIMAYSSTLLTGV